MISFTLEIVNSGTGPAYDLAVEDLMADTGLSLVTGSVTASDGSTATEVANPDATLGFTLAADVLDAGETLTITYQAVITDAAAFNGQVENTARVASFDTNPAEPGDAGFQGEVVIEADPNDPNDPLTDQAEVALDGVALAKSALEAETGAPETGSDQFDPTLVDVSIGETVTYRLTVDLPEGSGIIVLTDQLPDGLQAIAAEVTGLPAGVVAENLSQGDTDASAFLTIAPGGTAVTAAFGTVTSAGVDDAGAETTRQIEIAITAVVTDTATNVAGAALANTATVQVFDPEDPGTELTDPNTPTTASETIEIVEPILQIEKTTTATGPVDEGDILDFTLVIENS
ncbi:MAG: isopeptide-forming domain-containing fimbrial protein, partial [Actinomycetota bacterium]